MIGIDNLPGSVPMETDVLPRRCLLLFGQEGPGLSAEARAARGDDLSIAQFGSTRSINAGVAAGIAMHTWIRPHADLGGGLVTGQRRVGVDAALDERLLHRAGRPCGRRRPGPSACRSAATTCHGAAGWLGALEHLLDGGLVRRALARGCASPRR